MLNISRVRILRIAIFSLWLDLLFQPYSYLRFYYDIDLSHYAIALDRGFDLLFIGIGFVVITYSRNLPLLIFVMFFSLLPAAIIGLYYGGINATYANDAVLYLAFILKIYLFGYALSNPYTWDIVRIFLKRYAYAAVAILSIILVLAVGRPEGRTGLLQVQIDIVPAALYAYVSANSFLLIAALVLSLLAGKRMIMLGVAIVAFFYYLRTLVKSPLLGLSLASLVGIGSIGYLIGGDFKDQYQPESLTRISNTLEKVIKDRTQEPAQILREVDPIRFSEIMAILRELETHDAYLLGLGYGFRYRLADEYIPKGYSTRQTEKDHSNSHFTPLGIVLKFGILGFVLWMFFLVVCLHKALKVTRRHLFFKSYIMLGVLVYLIESSFAYIFFTTPLLPLLFSFGYVSNTRCMRSPIQEWHL